MPVHKDQKQVKLQPKYRELAYSRKVVPELKVSGVWLEAAGFRAGEKVTITIQENQLIITTINSEIL
ncbi:MAG: type I addiction module toxin, SymE family [Bacteroidetes bacterium]|nr:type I addiction module toxin, SymE family [Bacteroidota bacterium]